MKEIEVGVVQDYFAKIGVAALEITTGGLKVGEEIHFKGHTTDFKQRVDSLQIEHAQVNEVGIGASVGTKVKDRVRSGDKVYKIVEE
ncbi:MAG: translation elongation factor-like protein [Candidatus Krumholzibacteria bacterium]|nr:translation elongation factor-like protein [Candidatus Krumholzibacteria bacterium]